MATLNVPWATNLPSTQNSYNAFGSNPTGLMGGGMSLTPSTFIPTIAAPNNQWMLDMGIDPSAIADYSGTGFEFGSDGTFGESPSWFSGLGDTASKYKDVITPAVGLAQAGLGAFNAWNTNQTAKDQLKFQKESFGKQFEAQKGLTNSQLEDRQRARISSNSRAYQDVDSYMNKYGVK